jgi:hypothetical protein
VPDDRFDFPTPNFARPINNWLGVAGQPPTIEQAMEHQRRWGENRTMAQQLADIAGKTGETAWNAMPTTIGAKWMERQMQTDPRQNDPEAVRGAADVAMSTVGAGMLGAEHGALGSAGGKGIRAYHGSPHDFDKFDVSKIGTGEGAQAYGHGIYVAENPSVAESYRTAGPAGNVPPPTYEAPSDVLTRHAEDFGKLAVSNPLLIKGFGALDVKSRSDVLPVMRGLLQDPEIGKAVVRLLPVDVMHMLGGKQLTPEVLLHNPSMLVDLLPANANDLVSSRVKAVDVLSSYVARATAERPLIGPQSTYMLKEALAARGADKGDLHVRSEVPYPTKSGKMYEVAIKAHPDEFLDWDKPLSEQHPKVQEAVKATATYQDRLAGHKAGKLRHPDEASGSQWLSFLKDEADLHSAGTAGPLDAAGLSSFPASAGVNPSTLPEQIFKSRGIPGIKYLDQGSRNTVARPELVTNADGTQQWATKSATGVLRRFSSKEAADKFWQGAEDKGRTRNYVVFHHDLVDIMKKYGLAGLSALPAAGAYHFRDADIGKK